MLGMRSSPEFHPPSLFILCIKGRCVHDAVSTETQEEGDSRNISWIPGWLNSENTAKSTRTSAFPEEGSVRQDSAAVPHFGTTESWLQEEADGLP